MNSKTLNAHIHYLTTHKNTTDAETLNDMAFVCLDIIAELNADGSALWGIERDRTITAFRKLADRLENPRIISIDVDDYAFDAHFLAGSAKEIDRLAHKLRNIRPVYA